MDYFLKRISIKNFIYFSLLSLGLIYAAAHSSMIPYNFEKPEKMVGWASFEDVIVLDTFNGDHRVPGLRNYEGRYLSGSYINGKDKTGRLESPLFRLNKPILSFLIAGGKYPHEVEVVLIVGGRWVRRETGRGSNVLKQVRWDITEYIGKYGRLVIRDNRTEADAVIFADDFILENPPERAPQPEQQPNSPEKLE